LSPYVDPDSTFPITDDLTITNITSSSYDLTSGDPGIIA